MSEKLSPFDYINNILTSKESLDVVGYNPFMINRGLSYHKDCVFYASEMNRNYHLPNDIQYEFLHATIKKYKRPFKKWEKASKEELEILVSTYYQVNTKRAREILSILNTDEIEAIRTEMYIGGKK
ncbi:MAG: DNA polymerase clamp loader subunit A [Desulfuromonadaceae bacterium]